MAFLHSIGPDWSSKCRSLPVPSDEDRKDEYVWPTNSYKLKTFPGKVEKLL